MSSAPSPIPNPVYSTFAFMGFMACVVPFAWHLEAWNTGTCLYMFWAGLGCLNMFVNSIVWNGNAINWAPVWCDISSRIILGVSFAIPAASLCINRRLYRIASVQAVTVSRAEKRRAVMVDLAIGLGYPCLMIALQYIVQGHRFNIFEDIGCFPFTYNTPPAFVLVHVQPLLVGIISGIYCALSIRLFYKRNAQFNEFLSSHRNLTTNRYVRLMLLAGIEMITTIPLASWVLANNVRAGVNPWLGWNDTHAGFSRVDQPLLVGIISGIYCALSIRLFYKRNAQFNEFLSSHRNLTTNRYVRLMLLAGIEMITTIPLASWVLANNVRAGVNPWLGWNDTHAGFSRVDQVPAIFWRRNPSNISGFEFTRWMPVVCAAVFFAFFGFADEARKNYRSAVETVAKKMGYSTFTVSGTRTGSTGTSTLDGGMSSKGMSSIGKIRPQHPIEIHTDMLSRPRSVDSLTNISVSFNDAGGLMDEKEKAYSPDGSIGALTMAEINGVAADYNSDSPSSVPSSGPSSPSSSPNLSRQPSRNSLHVASPKVSDHSAV